MSEIIKSYDRKARKAHICNYCSCNISLGETYHISVLRHEGALYEWKSHSKCAQISRELWEYIDPDEGMDDEDFNQGCNDFCKTFICPDCQSYDKLDDECNDEHNYCIDLIYEKFQTKTLKRVKNPSGIYTHSFELVDRIEAQNGNSI